MTKPYRIIFKPDEELPIFEPLDPSFTTSDASREYFKLFFLDGYINRPAIWEARRQYEEEQGLIPDPAFFTAQQRRKILQRLGRRSLAFRLTHLERICL